MKRFPIILCLLLALLVVSVVPSMAEETGLTVIFDLNTTPDLTDNETYVYTSTSCGTSGNTAEATWNGEKVSAVIGEVPMLDGQPLG